MHHYLFWLGLCCAVASGRGFASAGIIHPENTCERVCPGLAILSRLCENMF